MGLAERLREGVVAVLLEPIIDAVGRVSRRSWASVDLVAGRVAPDVEVLLGIADLVEGRIADGVQDVTRILQIEHDPVLDAVDRIAPNCAAAPANPYPGPARDR